MGRIAPPVPRSLLSHPPLSLWDVTHRDTFTPAWMLHVGVPLGPHPRHPVSFVGEVDGWDLPSRQPSAIVGLTGGYGIVSSTFVGFVFTLDVRPPSTMIVT